ncbi:ribonuclease H-like domain-containing protein [Tanacetum coccineum]
METLNEPSPQGTGSGSSPRCQDTILGDAEAQTRFKTASKQSNDPPLSRVNTLGSGEDILKLKELMDLCIKLCDRVLDLETTKTAQAKEIASLKKRVKKLERKRKSKTLGMSLFKIDMDEVFKDVEGDAEQVISAASNEVPTGDAVNIAGTKVNTASAPVTIAGVSVSTTEPITTTSVNITTAKSTTTPTTTTVFEDEDLIIAQTLVKMRSEKSKVRGVIMQEPSETATRPTITPQQYDIKTKERMQAKLEEKERLARERKEDANIAEWDNIQAMIDVDYELAARLQAQEQEELTIEKKLSLFVEVMDKRKKHFARLRAEERRRKPLTKAQKRNQIETRAEGSTKRAGEDPQQDSTKKKKIDDDKEKEELKQCFEIVPDDEDDVTIDATPLFVKIPIVDYKIYQEGKKSFFLIIRADGIASLLLPSGQTVHSRFKLPLELTEESLCRITKKTHLGKLLADTDLIIWDEAPINDLRCLKALDSGKPNNILLLDCVIA